MGVNVLFANLMLVGVNNIVLYSTLVFTNAGLNDVNAAYATMGIFGLQFISACVGVSVFSLRYLSFLVVHIASVLKALFRGYHIQRSISIYD